MPTYFKFDKEYIDSVEAILKINLLFKGTAHRIISFLMTCNNFLRLFLYQRVSPVPSYLKSYAKI